MQHVTAADRVAGDHRDHRLRQPPDLQVQIGHVEAPDPGLRTGVGRVSPGHVAAALPAHPLVTTRAERIRALAGQDHDADRLVLAGALERVRQLDHGFGPERVADLGTVDRDLRDPGGFLLAELVSDVRVVADRVPADAQGNAPVRDETARTLRKRGELQPRMSRSDLIRWP